MHRPPYRPDGGPHPLPRSGRERHLPAGVPRAPARDPDGLPGPGRQPQPEHDDPTDAEGALPAAQRRAQERSRGACPGVDAARAARAVAPRPPTGPALGRSEAARRHRPRDREQSRPRGARRADLLARHVAPPRAARAARGSAATPGDDVPLHHPRLLGGTPHRRPGRRHVPGEGDGVGARGRGARRPQAPVHAGSDRRHPRPRAAHTTAREAPGGDPERAPADRRLPVPGPLPSRHGGVPTGRDPARRSGPQKGRVPAVRRIRVACPGPSQRRRRRADDGLDRTRHSHLRCVSGRRVVVLRRAGRGRRRGRVSTPAGCPTT